METDLGLADFRPATSAGIANPRGANLSGAKENAALLDARQLPQLRTRCVFTARSQSADVCSAGDAVPQVGTSSALASVLGLAVARIEFAACSEDAEIRLAGDINTLEIAG